MKKKVLFVCLGNICRSPLAEEVFRSYVKSKGKEDEYIIDSAGTSGYHSGELPDERMRESARRHGYILCHHSRKIQYNDYDDFDHIICMDDSNMHHLVQNAPTSDAVQKIHKLTDIHPKSTIDHIPDPYYGGVQGFERVIRLIEEAVPYLYERIEKIKEWKKTKNRVS